MFIDNIDHKNYNKINFLETNINIQTNKEPNSFLSYLKKELGEISGIQNNAQNDSKKFQLNQSEISLNDVMINLQKSSISIKMAIQIKNRIIAAYQDIMSQQI